MMRQAMLLVLLVVSLALSAAEGEGKYVVELNSTSWDSQLEQGTWLVKFYSPNCGFCKLLAPDWEKLAQEVAEEHPELDGQNTLHIGKINVRQAAEITKRNKIGKLPQIMLFKDGKSYSLPSSRSSHSSEEYIEYATVTYLEIAAQQEAKRVEAERKQAIIDASSDVVALTMDNFKQQTNDGSVWLIEFYGPKCGYCKRLAPTWEKAATYAKENNLPLKIAKINAVTAHIFTRQFKANPWPAIRLFREGMIYDFPEGRNIRDDVSEYTTFATEGYKTIQGREPVNMKNTRIIRDNIPTKDSSVIELTLANFEEKTKEGTWLIDFYSPNCGFCKLLANDWNHLAAAAGESHPDLHIAKLNVREARAISKMFKIGKLPQIKLITNGDVYTLPQSRTSRDPADYIEYATKTYEAVEKAEEDRKKAEAEKQAAIDAASDVIFLSVEDFEAKTRGDRDTVWLIEFYGPKCGYCKRLAPTWELLGTYAKDNNLPLKIAKIDAVTGHLYTRQFKANPWPAIRVFRDGAIYDFPEPRRTREELAEYTDFALEGYKAIEGRVPPSNGNRKVVRPGSTPATIAQQMESSKMGGAALKAAMAAAMRAAAPAPGGK